MLGALILVFILVVLVPVGIAIGGAVLAAVTGGLLHKDNEARHAGSELIDSNY